MNNELMIREVREEDAERLAEIYAYYVENTAVSFEYTAPTVDEFRERIRKISARYPYLVCEKQGRVIGYVYAGRYSPRDAYQWTVTTSIYIDPRFHRQGAGALLYEKLEEKLRERGVINLLAGVGYSEEEDEYLTHDSLHFHLKEGYTQVARMIGVGKKFDRWYDLLWLQKKI